MQDGQRQIHKSDSVATLLAHTTLSESSSVGGCRPASPSRSWSWYPSQQDDKHVLDEKVDMSNPSLSAASLLLGGLGNGDIGHGNHMPPPSTSCEARQPVQGSMSDLHSMSMGDQMSHGFSMGMQPNHCNNHDLQAVRCLTLETLKPAVLNYALPRFNRNVCWGLNV